ADRRGAALRGRDSGESEPSLGAVRAPPGEADHHEDLEQQGRRPDRPGRAAPAGAPHRQPNPDDRGAPLHEEDEVEGRHRDAVAQSAARLYDGHRAAVLTREPERAQCARLTPSHTIASDTRKIAPSIACQRGRRMCQITSTATTPTSTSFAWSFPLPQR